MPYADALLGEHVIHDADSHVMEAPDSWFPFADPAVRDRMRPLYTATTAPGEDDLIEHFGARHADPEFRSRDADEIMLRKNWKATGSFIKEDRPHALDLLGFHTQLVFNTFGNKYLLAAEHDDDLDFAYGLARAHNRFVVDVLLRRSQAARSSRVQRPDELWVPTSRWGAEASKVRRVDECHCGSDRS